MSVSMRVLSAFSRPDFFGARGTTTYCERDMTHRLERRSIDWGVIVPGAVPAPQVVRDSPNATDLSVLTSEALAEPSFAVADRLLLHAVEFAREVVGLERA